MDLLDSMRSIWTSKNMLLVINLARLLAQVGSIQLCLDYIITAFFHRRASNSTRRGPQAHSSVYAQDDAVTWNRRRPSWTY